MRGSQAGGVMAGVKTRPTRHSVGAGNRFGHPGAKVLARLAEVGEQAWRTDECGDVEVLTYGERLWAHSQQPHHHVKVRSLAGLAAWELLTALAANLVRREAQSLLCCRFPCPRPV
jgi:hypothetical protein